MRIEIRNNSALLDGYVNAIARDSRPMLDENGEKFVEQICPKTFQRALEKSDAVLCLLNHEPSRVLGSTKQGNVELFEDNIGLRAICKITDSEVIEKAKNGKLRG
ncbi:MAG: HK97 family phage prohead protease, partial [Alphaproteobacteria bacterium]|nr:HK97 family phage prohead protease [Alphaproteobacteria bacterium]